MLKKIVYAGSQSASFAQAAKDLDALAEVDVTAKRVERWTKRVGQERVADLDASAETYQDPFGSVGHVAKAARCEVRWAYVVTLQELASRGYASRSRRRFLDFTHSTS